MQAIADNFKKGLPWELLYADDLVLLAESRLELEKRLTEWMARLKEKGLRVNIGKTKVMNCKVGVGQVENSGKYPCGVCREGWVIMLYGAHLARNGLTRDVEG